MQHALRSIRAGKHGPGEANTWGHPWPQFGLPPAASGQARVQVLTQEQWLTACLWWAAPLASGLLTGLSLWCSQHSAILYTETCVALYSFHYPHPLLCCWGLNPGSPTDLHPGLISFLNSVIWKLFYMQASGGCFSVAPPGSFGGDACK